MKYILPILVSVANAVAPAQILVAESNPLIKPANTSIFNAGTSQYTLDVSTGIVRRATNNNGADLSAAQNFVYPAGIAGRKCRAVFNLGSSGRVSGSGRAQVNSLQYPVYSGHTGRVPVGQSLGTLNITASGSNWIVADGGNWAGVNGSFSCSTVAGMTVGYEIVPVNGDDDIEFAGTDGLQVQVLD